MLEEASLLELDVLEEALLVLEEASLLELDAPEDGVLLALELDEPLPRPAGAGGYHPSRPRRH